MTENRNRFWLWVIVGCVVLMLFVGSVFTLVYLSVRGGSSDSDYSAFGEKIAVVDIDGVIMDPRTTIRDIKKFADDSSVKAIVLHLNSPGGGAAASQEIYTTVKQLREQKKKRIYSVIETVGASGAYYVAVGTERIYANPASIVGSVGVIAQWVNYGELLHWAKLKDVTLKAGELKDAGSPTRDLTEAERVYLQSIIDDMHTQFIQAVAAGRKMKVEELKPLATGRVWTGQQAMPLKLVDKMATFDEAIHDVAKDVGIKGEPQLVRPRRERQSVLDAVLGDSTAWLPTRNQMLQQNPNFYYLWK